MNSKQWNTLIAAHPHLTGRLEKYHNYSSSFTPFIQRLTQEQTIAELARYIFQSGKPATLGVVICTVFRSAFINPDTFAKRNEKLWEDSHTHSDWRFERTYQEQREVQEVAKNL